MSGRGLNRQLLRVGRAAGRGARSGGLRFLALVLASAVTALAALSVVVVLADHDGRAARDRDRSPRLASRHPAERMTALWSQGFDTVGGVQHAVVAVTPLLAGAAPPPGLSRWPAPGEVMLSPALARDGAGEDIAVRYGRLAGFIGFEGLVSRDERLAYVRPAGGERHGERITGFGDRVPLPFGESIMIQSLPAVLVAVLGLLVLPSGALLVVAARTGSAVRDRRAALLRALGAGGLSRAVVDVGEALVPTVLGLLPAAAGAVLALTADLRLPVTGYTLSAEFLSRWTPAVAGALPGAAVVVLGAVVLLHRPPRREARAGPRPPETVAVWRLWLLGASALTVVACTLTVGVPAIAEYSIVLYALGAAGVLASLPTLVARFAASLPPSSRLLAMGRDDETDVPIFRGPCPLPADLGMACARTPSKVAAGGLTDPRAQEIVRWTRGFTGEILSQEADPVRALGGGEALLVVGETADGGPAWGLKRRVYAAFGPSATVRVLGSSGLVVAQTARRMADWVTFLGLAGLSVVLVTGLLSAAAEFLRPRAPAVDLHRGRPRGDGGSRRGGGCARGPGRRAPRALVGPLRRVTPARPAAFTPRPPRARRAPRGDGPGVSVSARGV
ncbi:hypothetical protein GCM10017673_04720 [Streptosporangium violaceochromogenes]|nr:hypothetical protein GCM10017673_04720 [Streptosporangium violaceochromogenes]